MYSSQNEPMCHLKFEFFWKNHTKSHWILPEYLSESIEPPKNLQLLKFSRHVKGSLFILENYRNKKYCTFSREKYAKFFHQTSLVLSRLPQQVICHLPKSQLKQDKSLINNLHFKKKFVKIGQLVQKLQQLMPFFIGNPTLWNRSNKKLMNWHFNYTIEKVDSIITVRFKTSYPEAPTNSFKFYAIVIFGFFEIHGSKNNFFGNLNFPPKNVTLQGWLERKINENCEKPAKWNFLFW
jgi:hypothetical protein